MSSNEDRLGQRFVTGQLDSPAGVVPQVRSELSAADRRGAVLARWGIGRMDYRVAPGLYALGNPDGSSPVMVSANYKMSFDVLRASLPGRDAWLLVLDTDGINVWCAAGKGTFGTEELVRRVLDSGVDQVVDFLEGLPEAKIDCRVIAPLALQRAISDWKTRVGA